MGFEKVGQPKDELYINENFLIRGPRLVITTAGGYVAEFGLQPDGSVLGTIATEPGGKLQPATFERWKRFAAQKFSEQPRQEAA